MSARATTDAADLRARGVLAPIDWHFSRVLAELGDETEPSVILATALVSRALRTGHVCLDLTLLTAQRELPAESGEAVDVDWPATDGWLAALRRSRLIGAPAVGGETPLVLDNERLYARRYWTYEVALARCLQERCVDATPALSAAEAGAVFDRLFGPTGGEVDWQRAAAAVALTRRLCVITGGPGTGKTHTVASVLALLAEDGLRRGRLPEVLLLAPTGKAAQRLSDSLARSAARLDCATQIRELIGSKAKTIHRALGRDPRSRTRFRHGEHNPLRADVVVVDEASMVDIALMTRLLAAIPSRARVLLLGDRDQLASVEAGAILADVCGDRRRLAYSADLAARVASVCGEHLPVGSDAGPPIADSIVALTRNYRYAAGSGIGRLARAINEGDVDRVLELLAEEDGAVLRPPIDRDETLFDRATDAAATWRTAEDPLARLRALERFGILCALRRGRFGVEGLNAEIEARLRGGGWIDDAVEDYPGRPVMVLRNDPETGLFNGDIGMLLEDDRGLRAHFAEGEGVRSFALARLPAHETVYAMTIHKSQGSEFDEVAVVLPDEASPLLTRELLYTAVTRARERVVLHASPEIVRLAVGRRVERASGLRERLWDG